MGCRSFRTIVALAVIALTLSVRQGPAGAQQCTTSCTHGRVVCSMQARTAKAACMQSCAFGDIGCKWSCVQAARAARATCRATRADCMTTCPTADVAAPSCIEGCSLSAKACFADVLASGTSCVTDCKATDAGELKSCLEQCAATIGAGGAICLATFQGCLVGCQGEPTGACFSTVAMECTTEACGPGHRCDQPNEFCSERCAQPPTAGSCLDPASGQCTGVACSPDQPCSAGQPCLPVCPPPLPQGLCFDTTTRQCTDQACDRTHRCATENHVCTLQCPPPTPTPQCSGIPCDGRCLIEPICLPGQPCPKYPSRLGQCMSDDAGNCGCVPVSPPPTPTPQPTPTSQCDPATCGGSCVITSFRCPPDKLCNEPRDVKGECTVMADGQCECVPLLPTPPPTPTSQCNDSECGGRCFITPPCPFPGFCPAVVVAGHCSVAADGSCACVPDEQPTPVPGCATDANCGDGNGCTADRCVNGTCEHVCLCVNAGGLNSCCPGPAAFCVSPCGVDAGGVCGGFCPDGSICKSLEDPDGGCGCVSGQEGSGPGGPCGGTILGRPLKCAPGLVCHQTFPDVVGYCEKPNCVSLFASGCSDTSDCCEPCENGTHAPCGVCLNGICEGAP